MKSIPESQKVLKSVFLSQWTQKGVSKKYFLDFFISDILCGAKKQKIVGFIFSENLWKNQGPHFFWGAGVACIFCHTRGAEMDSDVSNIFFEIEKNFPTHLFLFFKKNLLSHSFFPGIWEWSRFWKFFTTFPPTPEESERPTETAQQKRSKQKTKTASSRSVHRWRWTGQEKNVPKLCFWSKCFCFPSNCPPSK